MTSSGIAQCSRRWLAWPPTYNLGPRCARFWYAWQCEIDYLRITFWEDRLPEFGMLND